MSQFSGSNNVSNPLENPKSFRLGPDFPQPPPKPEDAPPRPGNPPEEPMAPPPKPPQPFPSPEPLDPPIWGKR